MTDIFCYDLFLTREQSARAKKLGAPIITTTQKFSLETENPYQDLPEKEWIYDIPSFGAFQGWLIETHDMDIIFNITISEHPLYGWAIKYLHGQSEDIESPTLYVSRRNAYKDAVDAILQLLEKFNTI